MTGLDPPARSPLRSWLAVGAVTLGIFSLMTSELLPVGLLTPVAATLGVSEGMAGLMVTVPGIVAAVAAPLTTVLIGRVDRRLVLGVLMALLGAANLTSALAPGFAVVLVARLLVGVSIGGFWAIAGGLAPRLVPEAHVARATAVIFGGVSTASVLGVPAGTLIGDLGGWRTAFATVGLLALVALAGLVVLVPPLPAPATGRSGLAAVLRGNPGVRIGVLATFLLVTGHFAGYTFVRPILRELSGFDASLVSTLLLAYGIAGVAGNFVAGTRAAQDTRRTLLVITVTLATAMVLLALLGGGRAGGAVWLVAWGLAYGGVSVSLQTWMLRSAPRTPEAATALFVAMFNLSIALGALLGGLTVDALTTASVLWVGGVLVLCAAVALGTSRQPQPGSV